MLNIGCIKPKIVEDTFNDQTYDGIHFQIVKKQALIVTVKHDSDDDTAKKVAKKVLGSNPQLHRIIADVKIVDENGRIV